jgi:sulfopyruvate decarboxylase subunit alpha
MTGATVPTVRRLLLDLGFDCAVGVPDSNLTALMEQVERSIPVYVAPREDVAVAAACGLTLGGSRPLLYMKNAGLFTCGDALLSLARDMEVGLCLLVGWAGVGADNRPHHVVSGERTTPFLDSLGVCWRVLGGEGSDGEQLAAWYADCRRQRTHCALLLPPGGTNGH